MVSDKEGSRFRVKPNVSEANFHFLNKLVNFLNDNGQTTELYLCTMDCVDNRDEKGHFHVVFHGNSLEDAQARLHRFLPNYTCEEVHSPSGFDAFLDNLLFIGRINRHF